MGRDGGCGGGGCGEGLVEVDYLGARVVGVVVVVCGGRVMRVGGGDVAIGGWCDGCLYCREGGREGAH